MKLPYNNYKYNNILKNILKNIKMCIDNSHEDTFLIYFQELSFEMMSQLLLLFKLLNIKFNTNIFLFTKKTINNLNELISNYYYFNLHNKYDYYYKIEKYKIVIIKVDMNNNNNIIQFSNIKYLYKSYMYFKYLKKNINDLFIFLNKSDCIIKLNKSDCIIKLNKSDNLIKLNKSDNLIKLNKSDNLIKLNKSDNLIKLNKSNIFSKIINKMKKYNLLLLLLIILIYNLFKKNICKKIKKIEK
jgi:hypothetical protein